MLSWRSVHRTFAFLFLALVTFRPGLSQTSTRDSTARVLNQLAANLAGRVVVLNIAVRPGCEDFATLAYLHGAKGAKVVNAYVANGEFGESDVEDAMPMQLGVTRRLEADEATRKLSGAVEFLNFSDIVVAADTSAVNDVWAPDSLRKKFITLINTYQPDLILFSKDVFASERPLWHALAERSLVAAFKSSSWRSKRLLIEDESGSILVPVRESRGYRDLGTSLANSYRSVSVQQRVWESKPRSKYRLGAQTTKSRPKSVLDGIPGASETVLRPLAREVQQIVGMIRKKERRQTLLRQTTSLSDKITSVLFNKNITPKARRDALLWRENIELVRNTLLGVEVKFTISETIVTDRQVLLFSVDSVLGMTPGGSTDLYIPAVEKGWGANEALDAKRPLVLHEQIRLLSPALKEYDLPYEQTMYSRSSLAHPFYIFIIHKAAQPSQSFAYKIELSLRYAPRFSVLVPTPIVPVVSGEKLLVTLRNHSRDGVSDIVRVQDSLVTGAPQPFRLSRKDESVSVSLPLEWRRGLSDSTFVFPILIGNTPVAQFAARNFRWNVDSTKRVAVFSGVKHSVLARAIAQLGVRDVGEFGPDAADIETGKFDVICIDRRCLSFAKNAQGLLDKLMEKVDAGAHLVIFPQEAQIWNESRLQSLFRLRQDLYADVRAPVLLNTKTDNTGFINKLTETDFDGYIVRRSYNKISGAFGRRLISSGRTGDPLVLTGDHGKGKITYIDLAVNEQLKNVHPGTYRFLANVISLP